MTDSGGRYELPDPKCRHARLSVRVTSGNPSNRKTAYASVWVCDRDTCIEDAKAWAFASTHIEPTVTRRGHFTMTGQNHD